MMKKVMEMIEFKYIQNIYNKFNYFLFILKLIIFKNN